ncbi:unnamed protein product [Lymnaea stagnalis]|uniref:MIB/HERC2 domain-containing protein n=1 Tax=Lymnaea stagnalis TaxID=6523 RepID=A0AAV2HMI7_LYMST
MTTALKQVNLITLKLEMLEDERQQFLEAMDSYLNHVISLGHTLVDKHSGLLENFKDVSQAIETAMNFLSDKASEFRAQLNDKPAVCSGLSDSLAHDHEAIELSGSLSFEVLPDLSLRHATCQKSQLQSAGMLTGQCEIHEKQFQNHTAKIETLSSTLVRVIADLNSLKKQQPDSVTATVAEMNSIPLSIEQNESFVEVKKNLSSLCLDVENISRRHDSVFKEISSLKNENLISLHDRLKDLEAKGLKMDMKIIDFETKVNGLENGHSKLDSGRNNLESSLNEMDNRINEMDSKLSQLQERTSLVINEKEAEIKVMFEQLQQMSKEVSELKELKARKGPDRDVTKLKDLELAIRGLEIWAKLELEEKLKQVGENVRKLEGEQKRDSELVGEHIAEVNCVLDKIREKQYSLQCRIKSVEDTLPPNRLLVEQQLPYMKVSARVKKGPDWPHGALDPGYGSIVTEVPSLHTVTVRWDDGRLGNYKVGGNWNAYEIQLA